MWGGGEGRGNLFAQNPRPELPWAWHKSPGDEDIDAAVAAEQPPFIVPPDGHLRNQFLHFLAKLHSHQNLGTGH